MKVISIKADGVESAIPIDLIEEIKKVNSKYDYLIEVYLRNKSNKRVFSYDKELERDNVYQNIIDSLSFSEDDEI